MIIEVRGISFENKGAELMLHAVADQVRSWDGDNRLAVDTRRIGTAAERRAAGLLGVAWVNSKRFPAPARLLSTAAGTLPRPLLRRYGWVANGEVSAVLDASGFAHSDQGNLANTRNFAQDARRWRREGRKIVMLPQALGPFQERGARDAFLALMESVHLVYAREPTSYRHVTDLVGEDSRLRLAPDFTVLLAGTLPSYAPRFEGRACIIPNFKMLTMTEEAVGRAYRGFLRRSVEMLEDAGLRPYFLIHNARHDDEVAAAISREVGRPIDVVAEADPLHVKGLIGRSALVVSSRFHGLVSALSQGVPAVATGWSHKYRELLVEYGCEEMLIVFPGDEERMHTVLSAAVAEGPRAALVERLLANARVQKERTRAMWAEVRALLGPSGGAAAGRA